MESETGVFSMSLNRTSNGNRVVSDIGLPFNDMSRGRIGDTFGRPREVIDGYRSLTAIVVTERFAGVNQDRADRTLTAC